MTIWKFWSFKLLWMKLDILKIYVLYATNLLYKNLQTLGMMFQKHQLRVVFKEFPITHKQATIKGHWEKMWSNTIKRPNIRLTRKYLKLKWYKSFNVSIFTCDGLHFLWPSLELVTCHSHCHCHGLLNRLILCTVLVFSFSWSPGFLQVMAFEAGRKYGIRVNTISAGSRLPFNFSFYGFTADCCWVVQGLHATNLVSNW